MAVLAAIGAVGFWEMVWTRVAVVAIAVGVVMVIDRVVWPSRARDKLHVFYSVVISRLALYFGQIADILLSEHQKQLENEISQG